MTTTPPQKQVSSCYPSARAWLELLGNLGRASATLDAYGRGLAHYLLHCEGCGVKTWSFNPMFPGLRQPDYLGRVHDSPSLKLYLITLEHSYVVRRLWVDSGWSQNDCYRTHSRRWSGLDVA
jgi:hypothetical protein